jgi:hypothetical protein
MGEKCSCFLQVVRMILDVRGLIDWIWIKNSVKWYWEYVAWYCFDSQWEQTSWKWTGNVSIDTNLLVVKR